MTRLPPLPADGTPRYKLWYNVLGVRHSVNVHMAPLGVSTDAVTLGTALANLLKTIMTAQCTFTSIDYAPALSNVFNPAATLTIVGTGAGTVTAPNGPWSLSFVGRTPGGRKSRILLIGAFPQPGEGNWRFERSELTAVATIVDGLNAGTGDVRAIDGQIPVWHQYANIGVHDHYVKKLRQGAG